MRYSGDQKQKQILQAFENSLKDMSKGETTTTDNIDNSASDSTQTSTPEPKDNSSVNQKPNSQEVKGIAKLIIPKINISVAVAEGTDMETLKYAVGHFTGTAMPGEKGNFAVAGHRSYTYNEFLNKADQLSIGDEIIVQTKKGEFTYIIYETKVVLPEEISVLDPTKDATCTLVTCTPIRVATHRLIIKGRLKTA